MCHAWLQTSAIYMQVKETLLGSVTKKDSQRIGWVGRRSHVRERRLTLQAGEIGILWFCLQQVRQSCIPVPKATTLGREKGDWLWGNEQGKCSHRRQHWNNGVSQHMQSDNRDSESKAISPTSDTIILTIRHTRNTILKSNGIITMKIYTNKWMACPIKSC